MSFYKLILFNSGMSEDFGRNGFYITENQRRNLIEMINSGDRTKMVTLENGVSFHPYEVEKIVPTTLPEYEVRAFKYVEKQVQIEDIQESMRLTEATTNAFLESDAPEEEKESRKRVVAEIMKGYRRRIEEIRTGKSMTEPEPAKLGWRGSFKSIEMGNENER